jgi:hypothetical protein
VEAVHVRGKLSREGAGAKPGENTDRFQDYITKLREAGLTVIDTTQPGAATVIIARLRKQRKH